MKKYVCMFNEDRTGTSFKWIRPDTIKAQDHREVARKYARLDKDEFGEDMCTKVLVRDLKTGEKKVFQLERIVRVKWTCVDATEDFTDEHGFFLDDNGQLIELEDDA